MVHIGQLFVSLGLTLFNAGVKGQLIVPCEIRRPVEVLTLVHAGASQGESALYPYVSSPHHVLTTRMGSGFQWSYASAFVCNPSVTSDCYRPIPGTWANGTNAAPWNGFMDLVRRNLGCNYERQLESIPFPEYIAHAAATGGFSSPSHDAIRVIVLFAHSGPSFTKNASKSSVPDSLNCQDRDLMSAEQFVPVLDKTQTNVFVVTDHGVTRQWEKFRKSADLSVHRMRVIPGRAPPTAGNVANVEWAFYHYICSLNDAQPSPTSNPGATTTTTRPTTRTTTTRPTTRTTTTRPTTRTTTTTRRTTRRVSRRANDFEDASESEHSNTVVQTL